MIIEFMHEKQLSAIDEKLFKFNQREIFLVLAYLLDESNALK